MPSKRLDSGATVGDRGVLPSMQEPDQLDDHSFF
jgi:hypothetical protein